MIGEQLECGGRVRIAGNVSSVARRIFQVEKLNQKQKSTKIDLSGSKKRERERMRRKCGYWFEWLVGFDLKGGHVVELKADHVRVEADGAARSTLVEAASLPVGLDAHVCRVESVEQVRVLVALAQNGRHGVDDALEERAAALGNLLGLLLVGALFGRVGVAGDRRLRILLDRHALIGVHENGLLDGVLEPLEVVAVVDVACRLEVSAHVARSFERLDVGLGDVLGEGQRAGRARQAGELEYGRVVSASHLEIVQALAHVEEGEHAEALLNGAQRVELLTLGVVSPGQPWLIGRRLGLRHLCCYGNRRRRRRLLSRAICGPLDARRVLGLYRRVDHLVRVAIGQIVAHRVGRRLGLVARMVDVLAAVKR